MFPNKKLLPVSLLSCLFVLGLSTAGTAKVLQVPTQYPAIQKAIDNAQPGDKIKVAAGTYREHIVLKSGITLDGEDAKTTTITSMTYPEWPLVTAEGDCTLSGFTIKAGNGGRNGSVLVSGGSPLITLNIICDNDNIGISINEDATPTIKENLIYNNRGVGINVVSSAPFIVQNEIFKNRGNGISLLRSAAWIENNHIYQNSESGISVSYGTGKDLKESVPARGSSGPEETMIIGNKIEENNAAGIVCEKTSPTIMNNTISNKGRPALLLFASGAIIRDNHLISSGPPAVNINPGSFPLIEDNKISGTRRFPIIGDTSNASIRNNEIGNIWEPKGNLQLH